MVGLNTRIPTLALLAVLAAAVAIPAVTADPMDAIDAPVRPGDPVDADIPIEGVLVDYLFDALERVGRTFFIPDPVKENIKVASFDVQCKTNEAGQRECKGAVCWADTGRGSLPVSTGRPDEGLYGVGADLNPDADGWYGPYQGVYISKGANCGCLSGVELKWVAE